MPSNKKLLQAAAGSAGGDPLYVEDVFSTFLYTGTGSPNVINNGIDLAGEGGLVWIKRRTGGESHNLIDTLRGVSKVLHSQTYTGAFTSFNSNGFTVNQSGYAVNDTGKPLASWTFRKAEKFFDVVTYTGDGTNAKTISHNLGSVPAMMFVKRTDASVYWLVYDGSQGYTKYALLDSTQGFNAGPGYWNQAPTSTSFTVGDLYNDGGTNASGGTYVAYIFASDAGGFGDDGDENIIKCGSYTGTGTAGLAVAVGFEPQFVMFKAAVGTTSNWTMLDSMRGIVTGGEDRQLYANSSGGEGGGIGIELTANGFNVMDTSGAYNTNGATYIYIAIRRPMKTPTAGTEVFAMDTLGSTGDANQPGYRSPFPVDMGLKTALTGNQRQISTRLLQGTELLTESTAAEAASSSKQFDYMNGTDTSTATSSVNMMWMFKRATGFMDVVAYEWNGTATRDVVHGLTVAPELYIVKRRNSSSLGWYAWHSAFAGTNSSIVLNTTAAKATTGIFTTSDPTSSTFPVANDGSVNASGGTYITYLFATLAGVSKVGSYTGTGADLNVSCGFTAGARFILIKRSDSAGDWYVWDSLRGISAGNDPYFFLNDTAAEVTGTDYVDPLNAGFTVTSNASSTVNVNGGTYIFLAIA